MTEREVWRRRLTSVEAAAFSGLICGIGWIVALRGLFSSPGVGSSQQEIADYYTQEAAGSISLYLALVVLGTIGFLWFVGVVRSRLAGRENPMVGTVFLSSSVLLSGLMLVGAAAVGAPSFLLVVGDQVPDPGASQMFRAAGVVILAVFVPRVATLVMFSAASLSRSAQVLPHWLIVLTYAVGVIEFVNVTVSEPVLYVFPGWVALVATVLLVRRSTQPQVVGGAGR